MKKLMILAGLVLLSGLPDCQTGSQGEKIEDYIPHDAVVVAKIGDLGKFYEGFSKTGLGKLFTDKEIGEFLNSIPQIKKVLDEAKQKLEDLEKELGGKIDDFVKKIQDVWLASWSTKEIDTPPWFGIRFANKEIASAVEKLLKSKSPEKVQYKTKGSVLFIAFEKGRIPEKTVKTNITSNKLYQAALSKVKPQDNGLFCFVNLEEIIKKQPLGETQKKLGVECFKYVAGAVQANGEFIDWNIHAAVDDSVNGLIPELAKALSGKASLKSVPASSLGCVSSGLDLSSCLKKVQEYLEKNDKNALEGMRKTSEHIENNLGVDLYQFVSLYDKFVYYVTVNKELKLTDTVFSFKTANAEALGKLIKYCESLGVLTKKDTDTYRFVIPNSPMPFDRVMVKGDTVYLGGSTEALKTHLKDSPKQLQDDKAFKELIKGNEDASLIIYVNWEGTINYLYDQLGMMLVMFLKSKGIDINDPPIKRVAQLFGKSVDCFRIERNGITFTSRTNNFLSFNVAVLAAIAIPGILQATRAGNERNAAESLKSLAASNVWFKKEYGNYWVGDVSGLYRYKGCKITEQSVAQADAAPIKDKNFKGYFIDKPLPKGGYLFKVLKSYETEDGKTENYNDGKNMNSGRFGFCAYPAEYGGGGRLTFIIEASTAGRVYKKDTLGKPVDVFPLDPLKEGWSKTE